MRAFGNLPDAEKRGHGYLYQRGMQQQIALAVGMGKDIPQLQEVLDRGPQVDYPASALTLRMDERAQVSECPGAFFLLCFCFFSPSSPFLLFIDGFLS